VAKKGLDFRF